MKDEFQQPVDDEDRLMRTLRRGDDFEVSAVKRCVPLVELDGGDIGGLLVLVAVAVLWSLLVCWWWPTWKLGVVRRKHGVPTGRVVYKQRLARGADLEASVAGVVARIERGDFDEVRAPRLRPTTYRRSRGLLQPG